LFTGINEGYEAVVLPQRDYFFILGLIITGCVGGAGIFCFDEGMGGGPVCGIGGGIFLFVSSVFI